MYYKYRNLMEAGFSLLDEHEKGKEEKEDEELVLEDRLY
jgi:hypothetical protein